MPRRFLFAYALLVLLPLATIIPVLKLGNFLSAPAAVGGQWMISSTASNLERYNCNESIRSSDPSQLAILQSGKSVAVTLKAGGIYKGSAVIDDKRLSGYLALETIEPDPATHSNNIGYQFKALLSRAEVETLDGTLKSINVPACTIVFTAVRPGREALQARRFVSTSSTGTICLQLVVVLSLCQLLGRSAEWLHQPRVIGEMAAGILLGPSLLGWAAPNVSAYVFPAESVGTLKSLSELGIAVFIFIVGLKIDLKELRKRGHAALLTSHVSITVPFVLAICLSLFLYPRVSDSSVDFVSFALFMGAAMSITAFPVLVRILTDRGILWSPLGTTAVACAAVDDASGWCILACSLLAAHTGHAVLSALSTVVGLLMFVTGMIFIMRPFLQVLSTFYEPWGQVSESFLGLLCLLLLAAAFVTDVLGLHALFGVFVLGVVMPKEQNIVKYIRQRFEPLTIVVMPLFFAVTGLRTRLELLSSESAWLYCALIVVTAAVAKLGGCMVAGYVSGMPLSEAASLGILMNTRGLVELVVLNIGLDIGVISPILFSMMVVMALVTTFMTAPLLQLTELAGAPQERDVAIYSIDS